MRRCKIHTAAYATVDKVIDVLTHRPGGYTFWSALPKKGRHNVTALRQTLADVILTSLFPPMFINMLLQSALTKGGQPLQDSPLYKWLLVNVYNNDVNELYRAWLACKGK